jgi:hypothetical protein
MSNLPQQGDVITSPKFAFGSFDSNGRFWVDGTTRVHSVTKRLTEDERVELAAKTGKIPPKQEVTRTPTYDEARGTARFVVTNAKMTGGGTGHGPHDTFPDGWQIEARKLAQDGSYDPSGETIYFYMTGCFTTMVHPGELDVVDRLELSFA